MDPSELLRARNDGKVEWILPIAYYPLQTAEYATVILDSDWLYFSRHGINTCMTCLGLRVHVLTTLALICIENTTV